MSVRKVVAINAARKNFSTAKLLKRALEGAREKGAETELIHLHDFNVNGCYGCMACKSKKNIPPTGCYHKDDLTPILEKCVKADGLIVGGPIYFWQPGGFFKSFSERFLYPYFKYGSTMNYYPNKKQKAALIFSMGAPKEMFPDFKGALEIWKNAYKRTIPDIRFLDVFRTWHVHDFPKYDLDCLNEPERKQYNDATWDTSLNEAYKIGQELAAAE